MAFTDTFHFHGKKITLALGGLSVYFFPRDIKSARDILNFHFCHGHFFDVTGTFSKIVTGILKMSRAQMSRALVTGTFRFLKIVTGTHKNVTGTFWTHSENTGDRSPDLFHGIFEIVRGKDCPYYEVHVRWTFWNSLSGCVFLKQTLWEI